MAMQESIRMGFARTMFEGMFDGCWCFGAATYPLVVALCCIVQERTHSPSHTVAVEVSSMRGACLSI